MKAPSLKLSTEPGEMKPCTNKDSSGHKHGCDCNQCTRTTLPPYREDCPPKYCPDFCHGLKGGAREVFAKYNSAVVRVHSQWLFTTKTDPATIQKDSLVNLEMHGNGFFVLSKHIIIVPAHLVFAPPNSSLGYNQYPFDTDTITGDVTGPPHLFATYKEDAIYPANRILVDVLDVNGGKHSYTYQASLLGYSGFGDVAVLYIDSNIPWNCHLPCIKECHPHFRFGCSRKYKPGEKVYAIGDSETRSLSGINNFCAPLNRTRSHVVLEGVVRDNRHLDYAGFAQQELVAVDLPIFDRRTGLPLIDKFGHVIGMQTMTSTGGVTASNNKANKFHAATIPPIDFNCSLYVPPNGDGYVAGPSQFFLMHIIKILICPNKPCNRNFVELVETSYLGNFYRYKQGFLGLAWEVFHGGMYQSHRDSQGWEVPTLTPLGNDLVNPNENPDVLKEVIGLRVVGTVKDDAGKHQNVSVQPSQLENDQTDLYLPTFGVQSPLNNPGMLQKDKVLRNDVIVFADRCPLGDLPAQVTTKGECDAGQIPISLVLFRKCVGEPITLTIRQFNCDSGYLAPAVSKKYITTCAVLFYDFPWYKYFGFPFSKGPVFDSYFDNTFPYLTDVLNSTGGPASPVPVPPYFSAAGITDLGTDPLTVPVI